MISDWSAPAGFAGSRVGWIVWAGFVVLAVALPPLLLFLIAVPGLILLALLPGLRPGSAVRVPAAVPARGLASRAPPRG